MGFLAQILLAVAVQALGQANLTSGLEQPLALPLVLGVPYVLADLARRAGVAGAFRLSGALARLASLGGVVAFWVAVWGLGWVQTVRRLTGQALDLEAWPQWGLGLAFAPFVVFQVAAIDAEVRCAMPPGPARRRTRNFQVRMFLSALVPLVVYLGVSIAVGLSARVRAHVEWVDLAGAVFVVVLLGLLGTLLPSLLRNTWETTPLPQGVHRALFDAVAARARFRAREVLLWKTGNTMANAAIVGLTPGRRVVLLSDNLLGMLDTRELATVYAHEIGHSKRHHVAIFLAWALFFFLGGDLLGRALAPEDGWLSSGILAASLLLWYVSFGWLSRRFELEADLYSMQLTGDPEALIGALERVGGHVRDVAGWRHFSTRERVRFLHRAAFDEVFRLRFLRRIRLWGRLGLALGAVMVVLQLGARVQTWSEDRLRVRLALGEYEAAVAQVEALEARRGPDGLDPEYGVLARLGADLQRELRTEPGIEDLEARLARALEDQDLAGARRWADLAALRGRRSLVPLADWLSLRLNAQGDGGPSLEGLPEPWRSRAAAAIQG